MDDKLIIKELFSQAIKLVEQVGHILIDRGEYSEGMLEHVVASAFCLKLQSAQQANQNTLDNILEMADTKKVQ